MKSEKEAWGADKKGRMTLDDVIVDLRSRGCPINKKVLSDLLKNGTFPFATVLNVGKTGRTSFLILRPQYEAWANENIGRKPE